MKLFLALSHLSLLALAVACVSVQAQNRAPDRKLVPDKADLSTARVNREIIEDSLLGGGVCQLPAGLLHLDRALLLGPQHSGGTLLGAGSQTVLRNSFSAAVGENATLQALGAGINYFQSATIADDNAAYILDPLIPGTPLPWDHPSNQPELLKPGGVVYLFTYDSYVTVHPPPRRRAVVESFDRATRRLVLDLKPQPGLTAIKWMAGHPVRDVAEGDRFVTLGATGDALAAQAADYPPGRAVYVTGGPSVANAAVGEHRRVLAADAATGRVTLDHPLTRSYADATLALVAPVANLTVRRLTVAQPANPAANPFYISFATGLKMDRIYSPDPASLGCCLVNCGDALLTNCQLNSLVLNIGHDTVVDGGVLGQVYGEEASTTTTVRNLTIRANPQQPSDGVKWYVGSDRLTLSRVRIEGFGTPIPGSGSSVGFNIDGREPTLTDVTVRMINGVGAGYLAGDEGTVRRMASNTGVIIQGGKGWRVIDSQAPGWELRAGTGGTAVNTPAARPVPGWAVKR
jgi:hypothetical protein